MIEGRSRSSHIYDVGISHDQRRRGNQPWPAEKEMMRHLPFSWLVAIRRAGLQNVGMSASFQPRLYPSDTPIPRYVER